MTGDVTRLSRRTSVGATWGRPHGSLPAEGMERLSIQAMWAPLPEGERRSGACGIPFIYKRKTLPYEQGDDS
uniref:Uncharacterized protein n=1 Tax=Oryza glumipatula TaxID=40148 RepID=A0A0E0BJC2_9ORYZ